MPDLIKQITDNDPYYHGEILLSHNNSPGIKITGHLPEYIEKFPESVPIQIQSKIWLIFGGSDQNIKLYRHQYEIIQDILELQNLSNIYIIPTRTSSGKSLIFYSVILSIFYRGENYMQNTNKQNTLINQFGYDNNILEENNIDDNNLDIVEKSNPRPNKSRRTNTKLQPTIPIAILLYPTKALAQNQFKKIKQIHSDSVIFDGDNKVTGEKEISIVLNNNNSKGLIILTNPDFLHSYILPNSNKSKMKIIIKNTIAIIIDEIHGYNGLFGRQVSMVLKRYIRLWYNLNESKKRKKDGGSHTRESSSCNTSIQIICASATIGHFMDSSSKKQDFIESPNDHKIRDFLSTSDTVQDLIRDCHNTVKSSTKNANNINVKNDQNYNKIPSFFTEIIGHENEGFFLQFFSGISSLFNTPIYIYPNDYSGKYDQYFCIWKNQFSTSTFYGDLIDLNKLCLRQFKRSICFCSSRRQVENLYMKLSEINTEYIILPYRGGYNAIERRSLEDSLFSGNFNLVICTNALELGTDISTQVDCAIACHSSTLTMSSLNQQYGRAGRKGESICFYFCFGGVVYSDGGAVEKECLQSIKSIQGIKDEESTCIENISSDIIKKEGKYSQSVVSSNTEIKDGDMTCIENDTSIVKKEESTNPISFGLDEILNHSPTSEQVVLFPNSMRPLSYQNLMTRNSFKSECLSLSKKYSWLVYRHLCLADAELQLNWNNLDGILWDVQNHSESNVHSDIKMNEEEYFTMDSPFIKIDLFKNKGIFLLKNKNIKSKYLSFSLREEASKMLSGNTINYTEIKVINASDLNVIDSAQYIDSIHYIYPGAILSVQGTKYRIVEYNFSESRAIAQYQSDLINTHTKPNISSTITNFQFQEEFSMSQKMKISSFSGNLSLEVLGYSLVTDGDTHYTPYNANDLIFPPVIHEGVNGIAIYGEDFQFIHRIAHLFYKYMLDLKFNVYIKCVIENSGDLQNLISVYRGVFIIYSAKLEVSDIYRGFHDFYANSIEIFFKCVCCLSQGCEYCVCLNSCEIENLDII